MKYATAEEVRQVTRQAFLALGFHEELASRIGGLLGRTLSGSVSEDEAVSMLKGLFQEWTKYYESELSDIDGVAFKTLYLGSVNGGECEVEVIAKLGPDSPLYRAMCVTMIRT